MGLVVPDTIELEVITAVLTPALTLRLYGNNIVPSSISVTADFTEIVGGGYANKPLTFVNWVAVGGTPSVATYPLQTWNFTGPVNAPGTIYGYYVTRNSDGKLMWAERFAVGFAPFSPVAGSTVKIVPRFSSGSLY